MTDREKLFGILRKTLMGKTEAYFIADHLIANGVTLQRWTPVTERLPETDGQLRTCLVYTKGLRRGRSFVMEAVTDGTGFANSINGAIITNRVTNWMPLPEPPKEMTGNE